jgi:hypothetical protein
MGILAMAEGQIIYCVASCRFMDPGKRYCPSSRDYKYLERTQSKTKLNPEI